MVKLYGTIPIKLAINKNKNKLKIKGTNILPYVFIFKYDNSNTVLCNNSKTDCHLKGIKFPLLNIFK